MRRRLLPALPLALGLVGVACGMFAPQSEGERLWRELCADCHGLDAAGNTVHYMGNPWADLTDDDWRLSGDEYAIQNVVREGVFGQMPANPDLTAEELRAVVDWLYHLRGETR